MDWYVAPIDKMGSGVQALHPYNLATGGTGADLFQIKDPNVRLGTNNK